MLGEPTVPFLDSVSITTFRLQAALPIERSGTRPRLSWGLWPRRLEISGSSIEAPGDASASCGFPSRFRS